MNWRGCCKSRWQRRRLTTRKENHNDKKKANSLAYLHHHFTPGNGFVAKKLTTDHIDSLKSNYLITILGQILKTRKDKSFSADIWSTTSTVNCAQ